MAGSLTERLQDSIMCDQNSGCWLWTGALRGKGYGQIMHEGKKQAAHRLAYSLNKGEIPPGLFVCHRCNTPSCVNPDHLFLGTNADNMADMVAQGRSLAGEAAPSAKLTSDQVLEIRALRGHKTQREISKLFSISKTSVANIQLGDRWKSLTQ